VAAVGADAEVECDLGGCVRERVMDGDEPAVEVDGLGRVLEEEADVRDEERLLDEHLIEE
jgi:hypothetical protein